MKSSTDAFDKYEYSRTKIETENFFWNIFCDYYLEIIKDRLYNSNKRGKQQKISAQYTLHYSLLTILKLLAPINPMFTYKIYKDLRNKDIHFELFPEIGNKYKLKFSTKDLEELNSNVWKAKKDKGLSLKEEIKILTVPNNLKSIEKDLVKIHNVKEIKYSTKFNVEF